MARKKVTAIIASYKEEKRIGSILKELCKSKLINNIIVVDDGSKDNTYQVVNRYNPKVIYIDNKENKGKADAMDRGVRETNADVIFFCDADLIGFSYKAADKAISSIIKDDCEMCVVTRHKLNPKIFLWSGQRAIKRDLWERLPTFYKRGFRIELGMNLCCRNIKTIYLKYSQFRKESKYGKLWGVYRRIFSYYYVVTAMIRYILFDYWLQAVTHK